MQAKAMGVGVWESGDVVWINRWHGESHILEELDTESLWLHGSSVGEEAVIYDITCMTDIL